MRHYSVRPGRHYRENIILRQLTQFGYMGERVRIISRPVCTLHMVVSEEEGVQTLRSIHDVLIGGRLRVVHYIVFEGRVQ